jgi:DNA-binding transcriptional MocR family regulator
MGRRDKYSIPGQWQSRPIEMLESPAHRVLTLAARRLIDRIAIELAHHAGQENGRLPVTFDNFQSYGIDRGSIASAIREAVALGFIEVTVKGRPAAGEWRAPNLFRITFQPILNRNKPVVPPTNDWSKIETIEAALVAQKAARNASERPRRQQAGLRVVS